MYSLKVSPNGYIKFFRKHKFILQVLDQRFTNEAHLVFAHKDLLIKIRLDLLEMLKWDEDLIPNVQELNMRARKEFDIYDDEILFDVIDPYLAVLNCIEALLEYHVDSSRQPGIAEYRQRLSNFGGFKSVLNETNPAVTYGRSGMHSSYGRR